MKRFTLFAIALFAALSFVTCDKDDEGTIKAEDNGSALVAEPTISGTIAELAGKGNATLECYCYNACRFFSAPVGQDGAFSVALPAPPDNMLRPVDYGYGSAGVTISNPDALGVNIYFCSAGSFVRCVEGDFGQEMELYYVDSDVTVTGTDDNGFIYNLDLKAGYNKVLVRRILTNPQAVASTFTFSYATTDAIPSELCWKLWTTF